MHHDEGVKEAFYLTNCSIILSFHIFNDFFQGTGRITDFGEEEGWHYDMNIPLKKRIGDKNYIRTFKIITREIIERYRPNAINLKFGADSISYDKLGYFCLTVKGKANVLNMLKALVYQWYFLEEGNTQ